MAYSAPPWLDRMRSLAKSSTVRSCSSRQSSDSGRLARWRARRAFCSTVLRVAHLQEGERASERQRQAALRSARRRARARAEGEAEREAEREGEAEREAEGIRAMGL